MKKRILIPFFVIVISLTALVGLAFAKGTIKIVVDNQALTPDVAPRMIDNRVMVPISFVSKALGANVSWNQKIKLLPLQITISLSRTMYGKKNLI